MARYIITPFKLTIPKSNQSKLSKKLNIQSFKDNPLVDRTIRGDIIKLQKNQAEFIESFPAPGSLGQVNPADTLFITAHGWWEAHSLYSNNTFQNQNAAFELVTVHNLADKIVAADLNRDHVNIVLLSCFGAGLMKEDKNIVKKTPELVGAYMSAKGRGFMAKALALALAADGRNYGRIHVTGYPSAVTISPNERTYRTVTHYARDEKLDNLLGIDGVASELAKTFNAQGIKVEKFDPFGE